MPPPVFRHIRNPHLDRLAGRFDRDRLAVEDDRARVGRREPEQDAGQLGPARADQAGQAEHLPFADLKADVVNARGPAAQPLHFEDHVPFRNLDLGKDAGKLAADHHPDQGRAVDLAHGTRADQRAVAERRHAVGDLRKFLQPVRDVDDADAVLLQIPDDAEEAVDLLVGQRRRGLVHDQDLGVGPERPRDLDELLLGHREPSDLGLGVDRRADPIEEPPSPVAPLLPADQSPRPGRFQADRDVLGDGQVGKQRRLLVDRRDPEGFGQDRVVGLDQFPGDFKRPLVWLVGAGDDLDERRLPRAILADQGVDLARVQVERDPFQGADARERFGDVRESEDRVQRRFPNVK